MCPLAKPAISGGLFFCAEQPVGGWPLGVLGVKSRILTSRQQEDAMSVLEFYVSRQVDPDFDPDSALESGLQEWFLEHPDAYWAEGETYVEHLVSKSIAERLRPAQPIAASA